MLVHFVIIWNILLSVGIINGHFVKCVVSCYTYYLIRFGMFSKANLATLAQTSGFSLENAWSQQQNEPRVWIFDVTKNWKWKLAKIFFLILKTTTQYQGRIRSHHSNLDNTSWLWSTYVTWGYWFNFDMWHGRANIHVFSNRSMALSLGPCHWVLVIGSLSLGPCHWVLVIGSLSLGSCQWIIVIGSLSLGHFHCQLFIKTSSIIIISILHTLMAQPFCDRGRMPISVAKLFKVLCCLSWWKCHISSQPESRK
jgi:hypothetical protein